MKMHRWMAGMLLFCGCGRNLSGEWTGSLYCDDPELSYYEMDALLTLDRAEKLVYDGELALETNVVVGNDAVHYDSLFSIDLIKQTPANDQDLTITVNCIEVAMISEYRGDVARGCEVYPEDALLESAGWDGEDTIWIDDNGCVGSLARW